MDQYISRVTDIVKNEANEMSKDIEIDQKGNLFSKYGFSSITIISVIAGIEDEFDVFLTDSELSIENFTSVETISTMLSSLLGTRSEN